jgi:hypothetical protein
MESQIGQSRTVAELLLLRRLAGTPAPFGVGQATAGKTDRGRRCSVGTDRVLEPARTHRYAYTTLVQVQSHTRQYLDGSSESESHCWHSCSFHPEGSLNPSQTTGKTASTSTAQHMRIVPRARDRIAVARRGTRETHRSSRSRLQMKSPWLPDTYENIFSAHRPNWASRFSTYSVYPGLRSKLQSPTRVPMTAVREPP